MGTTRKQWNGHDANRRIEKPSRTVRPFPFSRQSGFASFRIACRSRQLLSEAKDLAPARDPSPSAQDDNLQLSAFHLQSTSTALPAP